MRQNIGRILFLLFLTALFLTCSLTAGAENSLVGTTLYWGRYEQDGDEENGPEPVEWMILDEQEGRLLLLSRYALETRRFNGVNIEIQWDRCDLRAWMNGPFFEALFTPEEQAAVLLSALTAEPHPRFDTPPGENTEDRLFLLSLQEVELYFPDPESRTAEATHWARLQGAYVGENGKSGWWLRTTGHSADDEARVSTIGKYINYDVNWHRDTVRPAFWGSQDLLTASAADNLPDSPTH